MDQNQEPKQTGYGRKWPKWLAIYAVVGGIIYLIVYLVFLRDGGYGGGGGGSGGGGGGTGGYFVLALPYASAWWNAARARARRR